MTNVDNAFEPIDNSSSTTGERLHNDVQTDMVNFGDLRTGTQNTATSLPELELIDPGVNVADSSASRLYGQTPYQQAITADGVRQGSNGDCFYLAALAGMANSERGRTAINNMIRENADGSYTVTFPGDQRDPVRVDQQDIDRFTRSDEAPWARVMEAAFMKYIQDSPVTGAIYRQYEIPTFGRASHIRDAMHLLTGADSAADNLSGAALGSGQLVYGATSHDNVRRNLQSSLENGASVTAAASENSLSFLAGHNSGPLPDSHVYTVTGFDRAGDTVTVRNPWGMMSGSALSEEGSTVGGVTNIGDGNLRMSFNTFYERFSLVNYSNRDGVLNPLNNVRQTLGDGANNATYLIADASLLRASATGRDLQNLSQNARDLAAESLQAATSAVWYPLRDHPEDVLTPHGQILRAAQNPLVQEAAQNAFNATTQTAGNAVNEVIRRLPGR